MSTSIRPRYEMAKDGNKVKRRSLAANNKTGASSSGSENQQKLYSNFLPIPLLLPSPVPIASSSSKPITQVTHHIYVRPHQEKRGFLSDDVGELAVRTIFAVDLPVDMTERDLRAVFGTWGVIESVTFNAGTAGNALEDSVRSMTPNNSDEDSDSEAAEDADAQPETAALEPTFIPDFPEKKKKRRRRPALPPTIPEVIPIPSLNPRETLYGPSGLRAAHITYLDPVSVSRVIAHSSSKALSLPSYGSEPTGLAYYDHLYSALRPPLSAIKEYADSSMARFDALHGMLLSSRAKKQGAGALVDEDGFTVVVRGGRYGRTGGRGTGDGALGVGVAKRGFGKDQDELEKKKGKGAKELVDFYRFQKKERKQKGESHIAC